MIGSRRAGTLRSLLRGSVSRELAKFAGTPVVIVPEHATSTTKDGELPVASGAHHAERESDSEPYGVVR